MKSMQVTEFGQPLVQADTPTLCRAAARYCCACAPLASAIRIFTCGTAAMTSGMGARFRSRSAA